ncbi:diguanylate cyclase (GGDEF)-like protein [Nakamurella flavida]|nr:sensor domain-containing diguanylate cyclase [Nakamurella flavida]MDP9779064.1 diguanylate cyclase (GGDEF)-like protein [Nakamurella flavida]
MCTDAAATEAQRLAAVYRYEILDSPRAATFDRITALAARVFRVPVAAISMVDADRVWFASCDGMPVTQTPREPGLCATTILSPVPRVVPDLRVDEDARDNSLVTSGAVRFYAGAPLRTADGHNIGALCLLDTEPRTLDAADVENLADLAALVVTELELRLRTRQEVAAVRRTMAREHRRLRLLSVTDPLTGIANRRALTEGLALALAEDLDVERPISLVLADLDHFKSINDRYGHGTGDRVLTAVAECLGRQVRDGDLVARFGGEEFITLLNATSRQDAVGWAERTREALADLVVDGVPARVTASFGVATHDGSESADDLIHRADLALYQAKRSGRNRVRAADPAA